MTEFPSCTRCRYFDDRLHFPEDEGDCRMDPPRHMHEGKGIWPTVDKNGWCGRFDPKNDAPTPAGT